MIRLLHRCRYGLSLLEMVVAVTMMGVTLAYPVARYRVAVEQSHLDLAAASLRVVWTAQRMYWVDNGSFASSLGQLVSAGLLDEASTRSARYDIAVDSASASAFVVRATRKPGPAWSGSVSISQSGILTGTVVSGSTVLLPP